MAQFKDPNISRIATIQLPAGMAKPGASLASFGIDMPRFCREFNDKTKDQKNDEKPVPIPVEITAFKNKDFRFKIKTPPTSYLIKTKLNLAKGSTNAKIDKVGALSDVQLSEIAAIKLPDLNTDCLDDAKKIVAGTAKNMGIKIEGQTE